MNTSTGNPAAQANYSKDLRAFVFMLFFAFGGITSLNDVIIPKLKALFTLSYGEVMLVQSAFFAAYFLISIPAATLVERVGYMRSAVIGLLTMTAGCLLFVPASAHGLFGLFLFALFVLAAGITTVQVVANPLISMLGPPPDGEQPPDLCASLQLPGDHAFSVRRLDPDLGILARRSIPRRCRAPRSMPFAAPRPG